MAETPPPVPDPAEIAQQLADLNAQAAQTNQILYGLLGGNRQSGGTPPPVDTSRFGAKAAFNYDAEKNADRQANARGELARAEQHSRAYPTRKTHRPIPTGPVTAFVKNRLKQTGDAGRFMYASVGAAKAERSQKVREMYQERPLVKRIAYRVGDVACWGLVAYGAHKGVDFLHPGN
jgi:hypothetical protein